MLWYLGNISNPIFVNFCCVFKNIYISKGAIFLFFCTWCLNMLDTQRLEFYLLLFSIGYSVLCWKLDLWRCVLVATSGMTGNCRELFSLNKAMLPNFFPTQDFQGSRRKTKKCSFKLLGTFWPCLHPFEQMVSF